MKQIWAIAKFTIKENISNKIFGGLILFGLFMMMVTVMLKDLALYEDIKVVKDIGITLIEFFILIITIFVSSTQFLRDKKEKSIYLVLTKPVTRSMYIVGKMLGVIITATMNITVMALILAGLLIWKGGNIDIDYLMSFLLMIYKISIVAGFGVLFSVLSDSFVTANIFTFSLYVAAHGVDTLRQLGEKLTSPVYKLIITIAYYILPNFRALNYRDYVAPEDLATGTVYNLIKPDVISLSGYTLGYILCIISVSIVVFYRKKI